MLNFTDGRLIRPHLRGKEILTIEYMCVRYLLDEGIMLLKDGTNSASKFAPHLISNEEAEQFDLSLLSKVIHVTCIAFPRC